MVIGLAAYSYKNNDIPFNLSQLEQGLRHAQGKADLLCFGEAFLQGFDAMNWDYAQDREVAICQDDPLIRRLCSLTVTFGVDLLFGYLEREGELLYSSCMVIGQGRILHNYRRISRGWKYYWSTDDHYREGTETPDFIYKGRSFRIALCGDLWDFPERFRTDGILLWPVCCNFTQEAWDNQEWGDYAAQARLAAEKTLYVDALEEGADCVKGAFCFEDGAITAGPASGKDGILYVEV